MIKIELTLRGLHRTQFQFGGRVVDPPPRHLMPDDVSNLEGEKFDRAQQLAGPWDGKFGWFVDAGVNATLEIKKYKFY